MGPYDFAISHVFGFGFGFFLLDRAYGTGPGVYIVYDGGGGGGSTNAILARKGTHIIFIGAFFSSFVQFSWIKKKDASLI